MSTETETAEFTAIEAGDIAEGVTRAHIQSIHADFVDLIARAEAMPCTGTAMNREAHRAVDREIAGMRTVMARLGFTRAQLDAVDRNDDDAQSGR